LLENGTEGCTVADSAVVYEDEWGEILDRPALDLIELRWFDSTSAMSPDEFKRALATFAEWVERTGRQRALIDGTSFLMDPANMDAPWRDANIIPRYNAAGIQKFAFHMPAGMPAIGFPPAPETPGRFPTGYFGSRREALRWLSSTR
jgi:hypothetical protein